MTAASPVYREKTASREDILGHLRACNHNHHPPLDQKVDLLEYAGKIFDNAVTFEAWSNGVLVGLVAAYLSDVSGRTGYITNVSVTREFMGQGVALKLMGVCLEKAEYCGTKIMALEVGRANEAAIALYRKLGFEESRDKGNSIMMQLSFARK